VKNWLRVKNWWEKIRKGKEKEEKKGKDKEREES
jgi:hypothetical protein